MLTQIAKGRVYDYSHSVGRGAASGMGFSQPTSMAFEGNTVYVLNRGIEGISNVPWNRLAYGARVSIINLGDNEGDEEFTGEFGKYGDREGEFIWPSGMVLAPNGHIYVADEWMNMVSEFEKDGTFIKRWSAVPADDGKEHGTSSLAVDADGKLVPDRRPQPRGAQVHRRRGVHHQLGLPGPGQRRVQFALGYHRRPE